MTISKREKILIIIVVLLALFGAYYLYYLKPCLDDISVFNSDIATLKLQQSAQDQQKAQAKLLETQIAGMDEQMALYGDNAAHSFDQPSVLVFLSDTVSTYADITSILFEPGDLSRPVERYGITITMTTTYDGLKHVLQALEHAPYLIRVAGLTTDTDAQVIVIDTAGDSQPNEDAAADTGSDTAASTPVPASTLDRVGVKLTADFYCLAGAIPADTPYAFDTDRQYGGDIFY